MGLSLFIIRRALCLYGCMRIYAYNLTWGGLKNGKNGGEPNGFCLVFVVLKKDHIHFGIAPLSFNCFRRFSFNSTVFIHSPYQTGSQPMSGRYYMLHFDMFSNKLTISNSINTIVHSYNILYNISTVMYIGITGFCSTGNCKFT